MVEPRPERDPGASIWAVTSYYNPANYRRRWLNYQVFRRHLEVPLMTIEWSPSGRFALQPKDAEVLVQVAGGHLMWQKERLLNLAIARLPPSCRYVAWLDCDIVFERSDWQRHALHLLQDTPLIQLFTHAVHLRATPEAAMRENGAWRGSGVAHEFIGAVHAAREQPRWWTRGHVPPKFPIGDDGSRPTPGLAWAAQRALLAQHPLFDTWVIGGGDAAFAYAALSGADQLLGRYTLSPAMRSAYADHAAALGDTVGNRVGCLGGRLFHLWHGDLGDRAYEQRHGILAAHGFDPARDLDSGSAGTWAWRAQTGSALRQAVAGYFDRRREDGASPAEDAASS